MAQPQWSLQRVHSPNGTKKRLKPGNTTIGSQRFMDYQIISDYVDDFQCLININKDNINEIQIYTIAENSMVNDERLNGNSTRKLEDGDIISFGCTQRFAEDQIDELLQEQCHVYRLEFETNQILQVPTADLVSLAIQQSVKRQHQTSSSIIDLTIDDSLIETGKITADKLSAAVDTAIKAKPRRLEPQQLTPVPQRKRRMTNRESIATLPPIQISPPRPISQRMMQIEASQSTLSSAVDAQNAARMAFHALAGVGWNIPKSKSEEQILLEPLPSLSPEISSAIDTKKSAKIVPQALARIDANVPSKLNKQISPESPAYGLRIDLLDGMKLASKLKEIDGKVIENATGFLFKSGKRINMHALGGKWFRDINKITDTSPLVWICKKRILSTNITCGAHNEIMPKDMGEFRKMLKTFGER